MFAKRGYEPALEVISTFADTFGCTYIRLNSNVSKQDIDDMVNKIIKIAPSAAHIADKHIDEEDICDIILFDGSLKSMYNKLFTIIDSLSIPELVNIIDITTGYGDLPLVCYTTYDEEFEYNELSIPHQSPPLFQIFAFFVLTVE